MLLGQRRQSAMRHNSESPERAPQGAPISAQSGGAASPKLSPADHCRGESGTSPPLARPKLDAELLVQASGLDTHGAGQADVAGLRIHIPGLLPGEHGQVIVRHISPHKPEGWASLQQRLSQSPLRQAPICAGYGVCGGCSLQHLSYAAQLSWKHEQLVAALAALPSITDPSCQIRPCVGSPDHLGDGSVAAYRSRVKLIAAADPTTSQLVLGSYVPRSHAVIPMHGCRVHSPGLTATVAQLVHELNRLSIPPYDEGLARGMLRYVLLRETAQGQQQLSLVVAELPPESVLVALVAALRQSCPALCSIVLHQNQSRGNALLAEEDSAAEPAGSDRVLHGAAEVWDEIGSIPLRVSARSFLQVNRATAARIYDDVATDLATQVAGHSASPSLSILDVYCGVGGLGLTLLSRIPRSTLLGLEWSDSAIADAQASAARLGVSQRADFRAGAAEVCLSDPQLRKQLSGLSIALLNPPRRGCSQAVLAAVLTLRPRHIAYVSCSPESLARDLGLLCQAGYRLRHCTPYDMHPGTPHIESATLLIDGDALVTAHPAPPVRPLP